jgi:cytochrome bd ubiquinol oxidase subunit I
MGLLSDAAGNLAAARAQMALSLGWHIVIACLGVGFPLMIVIVEVMARRTGSDELMRLAKRWAQAAALLFAIGAVSGTILSFEMGLLWPGLMATFGPVFGFPFALEGIAFFLEAIFIGVYLYGWDRLGPRAHVASGLPVIISGVASAFFVVTANSWMNEPAGFDLVSGKLVHPDPIAAMFNAATPIETTHMILAAFMVAGFLVASVYAVGWLRGRRDRYHRIGFLVPFIVAAVATPPQIVVGDLAARFVAVHQPAKLAAMEGLYTTSNGVAEHLGGIYYSDSLHYDIEIPRALSILISADPNSQVVGLEAYPPDQRPPVNVVHPAFDIMVGSGFLLLFASAWLGLVAWRRRRLPKSRWFWRLAVISGPLAAVAMECGWIVTEVGRQPWIVYGIMRTADAVNPAPGLPIGLFVLVFVYTGLTVAAVVMLRRLGRRDESESFAGARP